MTGRLIDGTEAAALGLVNEAVPADALDARVERMVGKLERGATQAIRYTKVSINIGLKQLAHAMMDASIAYESLTNVSADHREGLAAFRERRKPAFGRGRGAAMTRAQAAKVDAGALPAWDLSDLYPGPRSDEVRRDLERAAEAADALHEEFAGSGRRPRR